MQNQGKLLYVVNDTGFFLSHRLPIACRALKEGWEIHVAAPHHDANISKIQALGFTFHPISLKRRSYNLFQEWKTIQNLITLYRTLNPHMIHHITIKPILYGGLAARWVRHKRVIHAITGLGTVFSQRGWKITCLRHMISLWYRRICSPETWRVIFQNDDDAHYFTSNQLLRSDQARVIRGSGVDITIFKPMKEPLEGPVTVLLAARMIENKGVRDFVEASNYMLDNGTIRFVLVGAPDPENPTSISTRELEYWDYSDDYPNLFWWKQQENMLSIFQQSHIVCLPSHGGEGVPKVLIEAAACGKPLIATDVPGCRDIVQHKENGYLIPTHSSDHLASYIEELFLYPEIRARMGQAGRLLVEKHYAKEIVETQTLELYRAMA